MKKGVFTSPSILVRSCPDNRVEGAVEFVVQELADMDIVGSMLGSNLPNPIFQYHLSMNG